MRPFQKTVEVVEEIKDLLETAVYDAFYYLTKPKYPIQVVKALEKLVTIPVKIDQTEEQFASLEINRLPLNIFGSKRVRPVDIISYYCPENGLFLWKLTDRREGDDKIWKNSTRIRNFHIFPSQVFIYLSEMRIAYLKIDRQLRMIESRRRYQSLEEAYRQVISILESNVGEIEHGNDDKWWNRILIKDDYIESDFFYERKEFNFLDPVSVVKIIEVTYCHGQWRIELEGLHQRQATLVLRNKQDPLEEPVLLKDDYYRNRNSKGYPKAYYKLEGLPLFEYDLEVLEVWVDGVKREIL